MSLIIVGLAATTATANPGVPNCTVSTFTQPLDHFDFTEGRQWQQRVFTYDKYWKKPSGPTLFYCGNEANVELYVNATGFMWENAQRLGARLVFAEHRYYGVSLPLGPSSSANSSTLKWLSMEQALADYSTLIHALKVKAGGPDASGPFIALGGSYGGMLAAWLRMHYPSAVAGAIAASAPVLAFDGINGTWDSNAYWRVVTSDATVSPGGCVDGCVDGVRAMWPALFAKGKTSSGRQWLSDTFKLCPPLQGEGDVERLAGWLLNLWDTLAMGNFPYPSNYLVFQQTQDPSITLPAWPFRAACKSFGGATAHEAGESLLARMAAATGVFYNASQRERCYKLPDDPNYDGIWDWQWCTERLPQETYFTLTGTSDMFWARPQNKTATAEHCARKYAGLTSKGNWIAASSAFNSPTAASNIVFSNGQYDPWRSGGVVRSLSASLISLEVEQGAHHLDLFFSNAADPPSVKQVRAKELAAIEGWIKEGRGSARGDDIE